MPRSVGFHRFLSVRFASCRLLLAFPTGGGGSFTVSIFMLPVYGSLTTPFASFLANGVEVAFSPLMGVDSP